MNTQEKFQVWFDTIISSSAPYAMQELAKECSKNADQTIGRGIIRKSDDALMNAKNDVEWLDMFIGSLISYAESTGGREYAMTKEFLKNYDCRI